jgi:hypothetical protein
MNKDKLKYYLGLLELTDLASSDEIKAAYRKAAKIYHPDKSNKKEAGINFQEIKSAKDALLQLRQKSDKKSFYQVLYNEPKPKKNSRKVYKVKITPQDLIKSGNFWIFSLVPINIFLIAKIGFNTEITPLQLFSSFLVMCMSSLFLVNKAKQSKRYFIIHFVTPLSILNILLCFNYLCSDDPTSEIHRFKNKSAPQYRMIETIREESTLIELNNQAYQNYPGIRLHFDLEPLLLANAVKFDFETGFFGIRVLKKSSPLQLPADTKL